MVTFATEPYREQWRISGPVGQINRDVRPVPEGAPVMYPIAPALIRLLNTGLVHNTERIVLPAIGSTGWNALIVMPVELAIA